MRIRKAGRADARYPLWGASTAIKSLIHSLIRAQVEDIGCLDNLLLGKNVRPNSLFSNVVFNFNIEVYSSALYYL